MMLTILPVGGRFQHIRNKTEAPKAPSARPHEETGPPPPTNGQPAPAGTLRPGPSAELV